MLAQHSPLPISLCHMLHPHHFLCSLYVHPRRLLLALYIQNIPFCWRPKHDMYFVLYLLFWILNPSEKSVSQRNWHKRQSVYMFRAARQLRLHRGPPNTRTFGWATVTLAQPNVKPAKGNGRKNEDVVGTLEKTPVVQTVRRRMQHRSELQTQVSIPCRW